MKLIFVNGLGPNYKGDNLYEFIFSYDSEVWGDYWDSRPSNGYPTPPDLKYISKVGILRDTDIKLELIQNSDFFSMVDAMDGVVALAWESDEQNKTRLVFKFGQTESEINDILYERDLILDYDTK